MALSWINAVMEHFATPTEIVSFKELQDKRIKALCIDPNGTHGLMWKVKVACATPVSEIDMTKGLRVVLIAPNMNALDEDILHDFEWPASDGPIDAINRALFLSKLGIPNVPPLRRVGALNVKGKCVVVLHHELSGRASHPQTIFVDLTRPEGFNKKVEVRSVYRDRLFRSIVQRMIGRLERIGAVLDKRRQTMDQWLHRATLEEREKLRVERKELELRRARKMFVLVLLFGLVVFLSQASGSRFHIDGCYECW